MLPAFSQMSNVQVGGATVFPNIGAALQPKRVSKPKTPPTVHQLINKSSLTFIH